MDYEELYIYCMFACFVTPALTSPTQYDARNLYTERVISEIKEGFFTRLERHDGAVDTNRIRPLVELLRPQPNELLPQCSYDRCIFTESGDVRTVVRLVVTPTPHLTISPTTDLWMIYEIRNGLLNIDSIQNTGDTTAMTGTWESLQLRFVFTTPPELPTLSLLYDSETEIEPIFQNLLSDAISELGLTDEMQLTVPQQDRRDGLGEAPLQVHNTADCRNLLDHLRSGLNDTKYEYIILPRQTIADKYMPGADARIVVLEEAEYTTRHSFAHNHVQEGIYAACTMERDGKRFFVLFDSALITRDYFIASAGGIHTCIVPRRFVDTRLQINIDRDYKDVIPNFNPLLAAVRAELG